MISLEFSNTKMDSYVTAPKVVRQVDWVDQVWPKHLKEDQEVPCDAIVLSTSHAQVRIIYWPPAFFF